VWAGALTDRDLVKMVTTNPARTLNWCERVGSLRPGMFADLVIVSGSPAQPFRDLIEATEEDVLLTVVDGDPLYGRQDWMEQLKPGDYEVLASGCGFGAALDVTDAAVLGGTQPFSEIRDLLAAASVFDFHHMKDHFQDPTVAAMSDAEFQAYLDARFPLGILSRPLDPISVLDDGDYFDSLRSETNVTALDPAATLDIASHWDVDQDGALNACDNCPDLPNGGQGPVVFGQTVLAAGVDTFSWVLPTDTRFVRGDLTALSAYAFDLTGDLAGATSFTDASLPAPGSGFYYLFRPAGSCLVGSWQTSPGAEPGRDAVLL
jgi:hypothetical protein